MAGCVAQSSEARQGKRKKPDGDGETASVPGEAEIDQREAKVPRRNGRKAQVQAAPEDQAKPEEAPNVDGNEGESTGGSIDKAKFQKGSKVSPSQGSVAKKGVEVKIGSKRLKGLVKGKGKATAKRASQGPKAHKGKSTKEMEKVDDVGNNGESKTTRASSGARKGNDPLTLVCKEMVKKMPGDARIFASGNLRFLVL